MNGIPAVCHGKFKFFIMLLSDFTCRLPLPHKFIKCFIQEKKTCATLLSSLGKSWHVKVRGAGETLHFEDGWEKFAEDHKLAIGYLLVFKHKGSLVFDVTIFDLTTCEREYHTAAGLTSRVPNDKIPSPEETPTGEKSTCNNVEEEVLKGFGRQERSSRGKRAAEPIESVTRTKRRSPGIEEFKGGQDHKTIGADKRSQFETVIKLPHHKFYLKIPASFTSSNNLSHISKLFLKDPKGVVWPTNIKHTYEGPRRLRLQIYWRRFCIANNLEDGDVCVFELREKDELHVQVRKKMGLPTYRRRKLIRPMKSPGDVRMRTKRPLCEQPAAKSNKTPGHCPPTPVGKTKAVQAPEPPPPCPCFTSKVTPSEFRNGFLRIPTSFVLSLADFSAVRQMILVDGQSRRWPVNVFHWKPSSRGRAHVGAGWQTFCRYNSVGAGDACMFKLTSTERGYVFHVEVIKPPSSAL